MYSTNVVVGSFVAHASIRMLLLRVAAKSFCSDCADIVWVIIADNNNVSSSVAHYSFCAL